jgi:hypothetical protein
MLLQDCVRELAILTHAKLLERVPTATVVREYYDHDQRRKRGVFWLEAAALHADGVLKPTAQALASVIVESVVAHGVRVFIDLGDERWALPTMTELPVEAIINDGRACVRVSTRPLRRGEVRVAVEYAGRV